MTCPCTCNREVPAGEKFAGPGCRERLRRIQARETNEAPIDKLIADLQAESIFVASQLEES